VLLGLGYSQAQALDRQRVLGAHVDVAVRAPMAYEPMIMPSSTACGSPSMIEASMKAPGSPSSPLQMRLLLVAHRALGELPLLTGREPGAAAAADARGQHLGDDPFGRLLGDHGARGGVPPRASYSSRRSGWMMPTSRSAMRVLLGVEGDVVPAGDALAAARST